MRSPAAVGSKEALRRACDEAVLELVRRKVEATRDGRITSPTFLAELFALAELGADDRERGWDG